VNVYVATLLRPAGCFSSFKWQRIRRTQSSQRRCVQ
jgi:hypothetical protein